MRVAIVYDPDPELGPDPLDGARMPRRLGDFIDEGDDAFVVWRQWGEQFEGGYRDHIVGQGMWENLTVEQVEDALAAIVEDS